MNFEFATANRIIFGNGKVKEVCSEAARLGRRALLITGNSLERSGDLEDSLHTQEIHTVIFQVKEEPSTDIVIEGASLARIEQCDLVIAIGGGSVIDAGKAVSALATNTGDLFDYLEVIGHSQSITIPPAPYIAIPTTAGTGTEVTKNSVLISPEHRVKVSMRSPLMLPRLVVVDPELTLSMSPAITASTGLDAITQLIEAFVSVKANPLTDGICGEGLTRAARSLKNAYEDGSNKAAREDMALASLFSGIALANAGLGAAHGFAAPLGGMFKAPHGMICARLLPFVMETNVRALKRRAPGSDALLRYDKIAKIITGKEQALASDAVRWIQDLCRKLHVPGLSSLGISQGHIPDIVDAAQKASSMKGNPIELTTDELIEILTIAL
ncbi:MAG TPA: iron-containing alcohol dehydrogenase [Deltaproteobacteria bacterium]|nr:iron-containing alcohol dehydrogenase [Deltaproteobacteria bacterium]